MKYLKTFEAKFLKHSDPLSLANKLRNFSSEIEDVLIKLQEINDNIDTVKRFFIDQNRISLYYIHKGTKLIKIALVHKKDNYVSMLFTLFNQGWWINDKTFKNIQFFFDLVEDELKEYITNINDNKKYKSVKFDFHISEQDKILELINSYNAYINSLKYNI